MHKVQIIHLSCQSYASVEGPLWHPLFSSSADISPNVFAVNLPLAHPNLAVRNTTIATPFYQEERLAVKRSNLCPGKVDRQFSELFAKNGFPTFSIALQNLQKQRAA